MSAREGGPLRILITGGTGFVGAHLVRLLRLSAAQISILASTEAPSGEYGVEYYRVEIRNPERVREIVRKLNPDHIYHLAGISNVDAAWKQPLQSYEVNVFGAHNLFDAAMNAPHPPRILNVSTSQVYAPSSRILTETSPMGPDNPYAASKAMAELLAPQYRGCAAGGVITVRSFNHTGPGQSPHYVLPSIAKQFAEIELGLRPPRLSLGNLEVKRDFTDVRDVVKAYAMVLERGRIGEVYNVCSRTAVAVSEIVRVFQAISGIVVTIDRDPSRVRTKDATAVCGDPTKIHADTGWQPEIPLQKTIQDLLDYWRSRCRSPNPGLNH
jgi:GDP-4-dehydro-6-deoxy-D-mannose reductase